MREKMHNQIMIIEDDVVISQGVVEHLAMWGYHVCEVSDFGKVAEEVLEKQVDLIIMDISLPFYNGFYWTKVIRGKSSVPILFLSSASDNINIVTAINAGGDDFLAKPFDFSILVAKIQALLRRTYEFTNESEATFHYGTWQFIPRDNYLIGEGTKISVTPNESKLLELLMTHENNIVTREVLLERLWEGDAFVDSNTLAVNINRLRKKLEETSLDGKIQTVKNKGYLLEKYQDEEK